MAATFTLDGTFANFGLVGPVRITSAYVHTNLPHGQAIVDSTTGLTHLGDARVTVDATAGTWSVELINTDAVDLNIEPGELRYELVVHYTNVGTREEGIFTSGWFEMIADAEFDDVALNTSGMLARTYGEVLGARIDGVEDHGSVAGAVSINSEISTHWLDATGATVLTLTDGPAGEATRYVSVLVISGASDVTVTGLEDVTLTDGAFATFAWVRGAWVLAAAGGESGPPDTTPPSAVTDLAVTPDAGGTTATATFTPATDAESTVKYRYRLYPTGDTPPAWPTSGAQYNLTGSPILLTGLTTGEDYTMELQPYSSGGSAAADSATFTTPIPPGWTTVITDTFTAADGTSLAGHVTDTGSRTWTAAGTAPKINGNKIDPTITVDPDDTGAELTIPANTGASFEADYVLVQQPDSSQPELQVILENTPQVAITRSGSGTAVATIKGFNAGSSFVTLAGPTATFSDTARVRVQRIGKVVKVFVNGAEVLSHDLTGGYSGYQGSTWGKWTVFWKKYNASTLDTLEIQTYA